MATPRALPGSPASLRPDPEAPAPRAPARRETLRLETLRLETLRLETVRLDTVRLETVRLETVRVDSKRIETVPRVPNPFARFRTRSQWLSTMIRAGRQANPAPRAGPEWFNR